jgi:hypothetical protein
MIMPTGMMNGLGMYATADQRPKRPARGLMPAPWAHRDLPPRKAKIPMGWDVGRAVRIVALFLVALSPLVHCLEPAAPAWSQSPTSPEKSKADGNARQAARPALKIHYGSEGLPGAVEDMREAILSAVRSGNIEDLRYAYELNELKPDLGPDLRPPLGRGPGSDRGSNPGFEPKPIGDPVAYWRRISGDGAGRQILAILATLLEGGYVTLALGRDLENDRVYVWPYFAEVPLDSLSPAQEVELLRLVPPARAAQMKAAGRYTYWRLAIGADGTWHSFKQQP